VSSHIWGAYFSDLQKMGVKVEIVEGCDWLRMVALGSPNSIQLPVADFYFDTPTNDCVLESARGHSRLPHSFAHYSFLASMILSKTEVSVVSNIR
jgi:hypothetical protein